MTMPSTQALPSPLQQQPSAQQARAERQKRMETALRYYLSQGVKLPLKVATPGVDDNVLVAFGRLIVDKGVSFLFGADVGSKVEDETSEAAQLWLDMCWKRNSKMLTLQKLAANGAICGHAFAKIVPSKPYPRVVVLDPQLVDVQTDPDDCEEALAFTITTPGTDGDGEDEAARPTRRQIIRHSGSYDLFGAPTSWLVVDQEQYQGAWATTQVATWPYAWPPIAHCQNMPRPNDFWGESDLSADVIALIDAINRAVSNESKTVRLWAGPKAWARGMGSTQRIDLASDQVTLMPSETAELRTLDIKGNLGEAQGFVDALIDYLSWVVRVPTVAMGKPDHAGHLSGVALMLRYKPIQDKTEQKRRTYGALLEDLDRHMLELGGFSADLETQIVWPELLPTDPLMERQIYVLDDSLGIVSKQTIAETLGYDFDSESIQIAKEKQDAFDLAQKMTPPAAVSGAAPRPVGAPGAGDPVPPPAPFVPPQPAQPTKPRSQQ